MTLVASRSMCGKLTQDQMEFTLLQGRIRAWLDAWYCIYDPPLSVILQGRHDDCWFLECVPLRARAAPHYQGQLIGYPTRAEMQRSRTKCKQWFARTFARTFADLQQKHSAKQTRASQSCVCVMITPGARRCMLIEGGIQHRVLTSKPTASVTGVSAHPILREF